MTAARAAAAQTGDPPTLLDLFQPEYQANPYRYYSWLRDHHPIYHDDLLGCWVVSRYSDVTRLALDPRLGEDRVTPFRARLSAEKRASTDHLGAPLADMMLFADGQRHRRLRSVVRPVFTRQAVQAMRPMIQRTVDQLLDAADGRGSMDLVADFAQPLSRTVIAELLGIPRERRCLLEDWTSLLHEYFTQSTDQRLRLEQLRALFDDRSAGPCEEATTLRDHMRAVDPSTASADELFANYLLVIDAGQVTTTYLIANAVCALLDQPDQIDLLRRRPDCHPSAALELMRFDGSVQFTTRTARTGFDLDEAHIDAGDAVTLLLASANRDPDRFVDPDRLDLTRKPVGQLSLGHGAHYCVGAPLALLELEVAIVRLFERFDLQRTGPPPPWHDSINFRFLKQLPVEMTPTAGDRPTSQQARQPEESSNV